MSEDLLIEALSKKEPSLVPESIEARADLLDFSELLGLKQRAQNPQGVEAEAECSTPCFLFIKQNEIGL